MGKLLAFIGAYVRSNFHAALEYRASMLTQVLGMFINDLLWVGFWYLYFTKFPVLRGWTLEDVMVIWASVTLSYGIVTGFFSNSQWIADMAVTGQLDYYLALPKNVLLHILVSRVRLVSFGDVLFGPLLLLVMVELTWVKLLVYLVATLLAAMVLLGFFVLTGSLVFFLGGSSTLSGQWQNSVLSFATYPTTIFDRGVKTILFTLVPAGFVSTLPVELVREFHWVTFLQLAGAAAVFLGLSIWVFHRGLRRYESGNLIMMRS